jgi:nicotinamide riboside transporter PnuC
VSNILFTAWGYQVSILEFVASVTSLIGVWLGTTGKRITWPFWAISSALYAIFFYQANLIAALPCNSYLLRLLPAAGKVGRQLAQSLTILVTVVAFIQFYGYSVCG